MDSYLLPIIEVLPPKLRKPIKTQKKESKESLEDMAAQIVYLKKHLT
jgi:hypothetical protein